MTTFPGSPKLIKGAIVGLDLFNPIPSVIVFQYNPATLTRTLTPQVMEKGAVGAGIYPQLSALEMLIYPKSALVIANTVLMAAGMLEITPPVGPFTLFIWGVKRVLPVRITSFSITEEAYDVQLNPIRARVSLGLRVLNYGDFPVTHPGYYMFLAHQVVKEAMSVAGSVSNLSAVAGGDIKLL
jgi:hypothetical protein